MQILKDNFQNQLSSNTPNQSTIIKLDFQLLVFKSSYVLPETLENNYVDGMEIQLCSIMHMA